MSSVVKQITDSPDDNSVVSDIIRCIHDNPDLPENQNVYMTESDNSNVMVYSSDENTLRNVWQPRPKDVIIQQLTDEAINLVLVDRRMPRMELANAYTFFSTEKRNLCHDRIYKIKDFTGGTQIERENIEKTLIEFGKRVTVV